WLIPRKIVERAGPWDERLSLINDFDFFTRALLASQGVRFCPGARTYYRSGNARSLSGAKSRGAWESALLSLELGCANLVGFEGSQRTRQACATVMQRYAHEVFVHQPDLSMRAERIADAYGGSDVEPIGGPGFVALSRMIGWRSAARVRHVLYRAG